MGLVARRREDQNRGNGVIDTGWVPVTAETVVSERNSTMMNYSFIVLLAVLLVIGATALTKPSPKGYYTGLKIAIVVAVGGVIAASVATWFTAPPDRVATNLNPIVVKQVDKAGGDPVYRDSLIVDKGSSGIVKVSYPGDLKSCRGTVQYESDRARLRMECK